MVWPLEMICSLASWNSPVQLVEGNSKNYRLAAIYCTFIVCVPCAKCFPCIILLKPPNPWRQFLLAPWGCGTLPGRGGFLDDLS